MKLDFKKKLIAIVFLIFLFSGLVLPAGTVVAENGIQTVKQGLGQTAETAGINDIQETTDLPTIIGSIINYLFAIVGVIFLTVVLIGGYQWMLAGGSEEKIGKAKQFIINGINGIIVMFLAYALVYVILAALQSAAGG